MSGARALASARRRRAGPSLENEPRNLPPRPPSGSQEKNRLETSDPRPLPVPNKKINPTMMLMNHEKILGNMQEVLTNLNENVEKQEEVIDNKLKSLTLEDNNIEFFKTKIDSIEKQLNEIKKHILKVQTFAMETNLQCIELKKEIKKEEVQETNEETLNKSNHITEILTNNEITH